MGSRGSQVDWFTGFCGRGVVHGVVREREEGQSVWRVRLGAMSIALSIITRITRSLHMHFVVGTHT